MPRVQRADHLRRMGAGVFDVLRLVEHHQVPGLRQPTVAVALQQRVGRDHHIERGHLGSGVVALLAVHHQAAQAGREALGLAPPVAHQADGRDDQGGPGQPAGFFLQQHMGQRLQRLAQAHVVGQDAVQAVAAQELQPVQALLLVRPQAGLQAVGRCHLGHL